MNARIDEICEQAALFVLRSEEEDWSHENQDELDAWLALSPYHRAAFLRLQTGWRAADHPTQPILSGRPPRDHTRMMVGALAAGVAICIGLGAAIYSGILDRPNSPSAPVASRFRQRPLPSQNFATRVGAQSNVMLADGSMITLNTDSAMRTRLGSDRREVWLDRGEAYFAVAHRDHLPFVVHAGAQTVTVLGTRFDVRRSSETVTVAVAAGRVRMSSDAQGRAANLAVLLPGNIATAQGRSTVVELSATEKIERLLAWRKGMLVFADAPLRIVVHEFNRYHQRRIVMTDDVASIRVGGAFQSGNDEAFLALLHNAFGFRVTYGVTTVVVSRR